MNKYILVGVLVSFVMGCLVSMNFPIKETDIIKEIDIIPQKTIFLPPKPATDEEMKRVIMGKVQVETEIKQLDRINQLEKRNLELSEMYNNQISADRIIIRPTYAEVLNFLSRDHTHLNIYKSWQYDCSEFSNDMIANAREKGIFACTTELSYIDENIGHMIVAFNTIDRGLIYIEPQTNDIMTSDFGVGDMYWENKVTKISSCWGVSLE